MALTTKPQALVVMDRPSFRAHFDPARQGRLEQLCAMAEPFWVDELDSPVSRAQLKTADVLLTSWGAPMLTPERLEAAPALQAVFHCAGSVRSLVTEDAFDRGITVTSASAVNAIPVAEYTLAAIIFAGKKAPFIAGNPETAVPGWGYRSGYGHLSNYRRSIGIVGFSSIGRRVVELLGFLDSAEVLVSDPYANRADVERAGGMLVDLHEMLPRCEILSLHAPDLPSTRGMIGTRELALLPDYATVINTARGALIDSAALAAECRSGRLFAMLDVTDPEPLPAEHPLRTAANTFITPHIAGSLGSEVLRLTDLTLDELERWVAGEPLRAQVTKEAFALRA